MVHNKSVIIGYIYAIAAAAFFGSVTTLSKPVLSDVSPILLSSLVYLVAGATFTPLAQRNEETKSGKKYYLLVVLTAIVGASVGPIMFFSGLKLTAASDVAILSNGETVFSILFAILFFKEKLNRFGYLAVTIVLIGLFIVTTNLTFDKNTLTFNTGDLLIIFATVAWALDNNISKIIARHIHVSRLVQLKSLIGGGLTLLIVLIMRTPFNIQYVQIIPIVYVGLFGVALSLYLYLHSIKRIGVVRGSSILSLSAIFGLIFAVVFLKETISVYQVVAVLVMLLGIFLLYRTQPEKRTDNSEK